jgi:nucleoside-diphosphate-sugar epimerase
MKTLIFGCGYLGQRLAARLGRDGGRVYGTVRSPARAEEIAGIGIEPVVADVLRPGTLDDLPAADRVFYAVGFDRSAGAAMRAVYVDGLQNVLDRLPTSVRRFVYASSTGVYGQTGGEWVDEESPTEPQHESGRIVLEAEGRVRAWADRREASAVVLRFAGLYGPDRIVRRTMLERAEPIPGDPEKFLNLVHIDDAARAAAAALDADAHDRIYLVADDRPVTRREYYSLAATIIGAPEPRFEPPRPGSPESARDATNKRVANRWMKSALGVVLRYPDITTGLVDALGSGERNDRARRSP